MWESISGVELQPDVDTLIFGSFLLARTLQNLHMKLYLLELSTSRRMKESGRVGHLANANSSCGQWRTKNVGQPIA